MGLFYLFSSNYLLSSVFRENMYVAKYIWLGQYNKLQGGHYIKLPVTTAS